MQIPTTNLVLVFLFALHYVNRAIVYPMRMSADSQGVPLLVAACAAAITTLNGYLQCFHLTQIVRHPPLTSSLELDNLSRWAGICLFFVGMGANVHADGVLRNLRRRNDDGDDGGNEQDGTTTTTRRHRRHRQHHRQRAYHIPRSPLFARVSCPNFLGEIIEWFGYSMASGFSLPSVAFLLYTMSNLIPRGIAHHEWYLRKFDDYPIERKWAVLPYVV
ncbi:hypothetical protein ACHAW5_000591 [Stephanodiscus triporus]|uniref:3-oxo-5-alpha-steroid 4-dehydrogenase C-terminal domain-containing protein n=1 Tax=Stephanodiscus triporus TaxID=2934178 RepID=A0ABD3QHW2_9STRA